MKKSDKGPSPVDKLMERVSALTKPQRIIISAVTFVVIVGLFVWLSLMPKMTKLNDLSTELDSLQTQLATAQREASQLADLRKKNEAAREKYLESKRLLPNEMEIPELLSAISQAGKESHLAFLRFQPHPETAKELFAEMPVTIEVEGSYHNIATFFDKVSGLFRLVNLRDIKVSPQRSSGGEPWNRLVASMQAITYWFLKSQDELDEGNDQGNAPKQ